MGDRQLYLQVEAPDTEGTVDFISDGFIVTVKREGRTVFINAKAPHGEGASSWDEHDFEFELPEPDDDE